MSRFHAGVSGVLVFSVLALAAGCGGTAEPAAPGATGAGATAAPPPPRPGEDVMKQQMEKLLQSKSRLPKGVPDPRAK